jgi:nucleotide-binding universal stress UspA family protein
MSQHVIERSVVQVKPVHGRIVAGFDGSIGSAAAVEWAAREAVVRRATLQVVMGRVIPDAIDFYGIGARQSLDLSTLSERIVECFPDLEIDVESTVLDPRDVLLDRAQSADLLVVGSDRAGGARRVLHGSVPRTAARRSPCPVVVVTRPGGLSPIRRIAIGVDGSNPASTALVWAAEAATLHDAELVVVHGWDRSGPRTDAQRIIDESVALCRAHTDAPVSGQLFDGDGATALISASLEADLIAIGSRGRSGFKTLLFGSVALSVAENSRCPVAITHPRPRSI